MGIAIKSLAEIEKEVSLFSAVTFPEPRPPVQKSSPGPVVIVMLRPLIYLTSCISMITVSAQNTVQQLASLPALHGPP